PEFIADLPLVARHTSPSKIAIIFDLTIPFGIGSKTDIGQMLALCGINLHPQVPVSGAGHQVGRFAAHLQAKMLIEIFRITQGRNKKRKMVNRVNAAWFYSHIASGSRCRVIG
ncbi:hypothetical protein, partial [Shimwellia pseudoproteus]|uniref:hypothetical protein n=1 Tax=Shimwellia pseudoproteus TaxID=570012 RepID=UPI001E4706A4